MKGSIVLSLLMAVVLLTAPAHGQSPGTDLKPTFISRTPGLYVNGWPAFTVAYPREWVEMTVAGVVFSAGAPRPDLPPLPMLMTSVSPSILPLEDWAKIVIPGYERFSTDVKVLSDRPSRLKDGTPAWEVEFEWVPKFDSTQRSIKNAPKANTFILMTKTEFAWILITLIDDRGRIREDLKRHAYSLTFLQGREKPVNTPPDVRAFVDMFCADVVSHDVKSIMAHFSDRFFSSGMNKASFEQWLRNDPTSPVQRAVISQETTVTVFEAHGDKAYVDGFFLVKTKGDTNASKAPMTFQQIIKEHGQWKWYGNQK
jgi:hypothetical protein